MRKDPPLVQAPTQYKVVSINMPSSHGRHVLCLVVFCHSIRSGRRYRSSLEGTKDRGQIILFAHEVDRALDDMIDHRPSKLPSALDQALGFGFIVIMGSIADLSLQGYSSTSSYCPLHLVIHFCEVNW